MIAGSCQILLVLGKAARRYTSCRKSKSTDANASSRLRTLLKLPGLARQRLALREAFLNAPFWPFRRNATQLMISIFKNQLIRHQAVVLLAASIAMLTNLGATRLWDQDEAYFAEAAVEMQNRGDWVIPFFNGEWFLHKPPFMFWMMMLGREMFGPTEFAVRFGSAVFGIATALLTYHLGRRLFNAGVGLWAGLIMGSTLMFNVVSRAATPDSYLVFFSTLALTIYVVLCREKKTLWSYVLLYAVMGLAVLIKGPIGVLLPMAVIGLYLLCTTERKSLAAEAKWPAKLHRQLRPFGPINFFRCLWNMRPLTAIVVVILVAAPWYLMVSLRTDGQFAKEFFGIHNLGRFTGAMDNHRGLIFYYLPVTLAGFFPWSIFAIPCLCLLVRQIRETGPTSKNSTFIACWAGVYFGFFSLAATKLPSYVLPAYPALALVTGCFLHRLTTETEKVHRWWPRLSFGAYALVGLFFIITPLVIGSLKVDGQSWLESEGLSESTVAALPLVSLLGICPLLAAVACLVLTECKRTRISGVVLSISALFVTTSLLGFATLQVDQHQNSKALADAIAEFQNNEPARIAQYRYFRPSLIYYTGHQIESCHDAVDVKKFLDGSGSVFLVTSAQEYENLQESNDQWPKDIEVVYRRPKFPKRGTIVVLGRSIRVAENSQSTTRQR